MKKKSSNDALDDDNESNGVGSGSLTLINLKEPYTATIGGKDMTLSVESVLAHELKHADDKDKGIINRKDNKHEDRAVEAADEYRQAVGEEERKTYR